MAATSVSILIAALGLAAAPPEPGPLPKIQDNSFLLEEAYNQEPGVIQHVSAFLVGSGGSWAYTFTEEWPIPDQRNQLSLTVPILHSEESGATGLGDLLVNYRFQAVAGSVVAFAPRLSLVVPTGDDADGLGGGGPGAQLNLPLSLDLTGWLVTHWNLGGWVVPTGRGLGGRSEASMALTYGASAVVAPTRTFNLLFEVAGLRRRLDHPDGGQELESELLVSPGARAAIDLDSGLQIVPGLALPVSLLPDSGGVGGFAYLSLEHPFF